MVIYKEQLVQRDLHYAIIDEVDSVLIDEARTPLIISGQSGKSTKLYEICDALAKTMKRGEASGEFSKMNAIMGEEIEETGEFIVNEKDKVVNLTADGVSGDSAQYDSGSAGQLSDVPGSGLCGKGRSGSDRR